MGGLCSLQELLISQRGHVLNLNQESRRPPTSRDPDTTRYTLPRVTYEEWIQTIADGTRPWWLAVTFTATLAPHALWLLLAPVFRFSIRGS